MKSVIPAPLRCRAGHLPPALARYLHAPAISSAAEEVVRRILEDVQAEGDAGLLRHARRLDTPGLEVRRLRVSAAELEAAGRSVEPAFARAARAAHRNIRAFARAGLRPDWRMATPGGGRLGEIYRPFDRVGVYIPGGAAPLKSGA